MEYTIVTDSTASERHIFGVVQPDITEPFSGYYWKHEANKIIH